VPLTRLLCRRPQDGRTRAAGLEHAAILAYDRLSLLRDSDILETSPSLQRAVAAWNARQEIPAADAQSLVSVAERCARARQARCEAMTDGGERQPLYRSADPALGLCKQKAHAGGGPSMH